MSYVLVGDKVFDSQEILEKIKKEFNFKKIKDLTKSSKRDDTLVYQIIQEEKILRQQIDTDSIGENLSKEEFVEELMSIADEEISFIEDVIPEGFICYGYSYLYEEDKGEIKSIFVAIDESVGEKKLKDVINRILKTVD